MIKIEPKDVIQNHSFYREEEEENVGKPTKWNEVAHINALGFGIIAIEGGYFGAIDKNGEITIPIIYSNLINFEENDDLVLASNCEHLWGFITWNNAILIPFLYSYASIFNNDGFAKVCKNEKYGYIDKQNNPVIPIIYEDASSMLDGQAGLMRDGRWGIINTELETILDFKYDYAQYIGENFYCVGKISDETFENYDTERDLLNCSNGKLIKYGIIDSQENLILDYFSYLPIFLFEDNTVKIFDYKTEKTSTRKIAHK